MKNNKKDYTFKIRRAIAETTFRTTYLFPVIKPQTSPTSPPLHKSAEHLTVNIKQLGGFFCQKCQKWINDDKSRHIQSIHHNDIVQIDKNKNIIISILPHIENNKIITIKHMSKLQRSRLGFALLRLQKLHALDEFYNSELKTLYAENFSNVIDKLESLRRRAFIIYCSNSNDCLYKSYMKPLQ